jgi:signal transduction histidine kinase
MQEDYKTALDEQGHQYLQYIRQSSQRMSDMVDDLLRLSRISRSDIFCTSVDLSSMVQVISQALQASHQKDRLPGSSNRVSS